MFKELLFDEVARVFNEETTVGLKFVGNKDLVWYDNVPYLIDKTSLNPFDWEETEVIPISEEYNQETPTVNPLDRSDYVVQYQLYFRLDNLENIKTALEEFHAYFQSNRQTVIDGYNVAFKVTRGEKQSTWAVGAGNYWGRYTFSVYATASKAYISKDTNGWYIREVGETEYYKIPVIKEMIGYATTPNPDTSEEYTTFTNQFYSNTFKLQAQYDSSDFMKELNGLARGIVTDINTKYEVYSVFDGVTSSLTTMIVSGASYTQEPNSPAFIEFDLLRAE